MVTSIYNSTLHLATADGQTIGDADMFQGTWTEEQYLRLTDRTNRLIEYVNGSIEVLPMPTDKHQDIVQFFLFALRTFLDPRGGKVQIAPLRLHVARGDIPRTRSIGPARCQ